LLGSVPELCLIAIMVGDVLHIAALIPSGDVHPGHFVLSSVFFAYGG
jgi:hypothetical protein